MAKLLLFIDHKSEKPESPYQTFGVLEFSRVPNQGEYVCMGNDEDGVAADYQVVLVHHRPHALDEIDAHVYMKRVADMSAIRLQGWPNEPRTGTWWKPGKWPTIKTEK